MSRNTHIAVVKPAPRAPLEARHVPTVFPIRDEIMIRNEWTASTPLDLHLSDGNFVTEYPLLTGSSSAGTVLQVGPDVKAYKVGDKVFGYQWREQKENAHQEIVTAPEWLFGKIPEGFTMQQAVTVPNNFVSASNTISKDLGLPFPWPKPSGYIPPTAADPILLWGAASSVGQYTLQILKYLGYQTVIVTASPGQHEMLKRLGAANCFNYRDLDVADEILGQYPSIPYIVDCIGSREATLKPISRIARKGAHVAVMLPVLEKAAFKDEAPEYSFDVTGSTDWEDDVDVKGVRTRLYLTNELFKEKLQMEIMTAMMRDGTIEPNRYQLVEGDTLVARAEKALDILRSGTISGERLVWRVSEP